MDFYLGIDIGTSRVKAVLFDQHFTARASAAENTSPRLSANGYAEQDMTQLWHSVLAILRQIARLPALQEGRLRAIGLAGQGEGGWLSDAQGEPVGPGILWSDTRSHELMSELLRRPGFDRRYFADTGTHLQPCNTSLQLYWLKQYQPERLAAARYLFFAKDWIRFRLTGVAALELTDASSSLLNQQSGSWSSVVMNEMGLDELLPLFPPLLAPDAPAGTLSDAVAALTGLPAATPVAAGALDVCSAALGCGAVNEGDIYTILGTTCCTGIVCRGPQTVNEATRFVTHTEAGHDLLRVAGQIEQLANSRIADLSHRLQPRGERHPQALRLLVRRQMNQPAVACYAKAAAVAAVMKTLDASDRTRLQKTNHPRPVVRRGPG